MITFYFWKVFKVFHIYYSNLIMEVITVDNFNLNEILSKLSKMDKQELEENLKKAKNILDNSNINMNNSDKK